MKRTKFCIVGGGTKRLVSLLLAMMLVAAFTLSVFAIDSGDSVNYTSSNNKASVDGGFVGACAYLGLPMASSGSGTVTKISNSQAISKALYYYAVQQGWDTYPASEEPVESGWAMTRFNFITDLTQIHGMGLNEWRTVFTSNGSDYEIAANYVQEKWEAAASLPTPPANFEVFMLDAEAGYQNLVIWRIAPTGKLRLKKASSNSSITG